MAIEHTVKLNVDAEEAIKQVDDLKQGIEDTGEGAADAKGGFDMMRKGIKGIGMAFKALGIGIILSSFIALKDMLTQNQIVMDKLNIATETINAVFQKAIDKAIDLGNQITNAFTSPKKAISELWVSLKQNIVDRFEGLIDSFKALGKVIKGVFTLDMDMIKEGAEEAGDGLVQLATGMTEIERSDFVETVRETRKEIKKVAKEANEYAKAVVNLRNEVKLAEANQRQLQLTYQKDAEIQRQIRDDISLTFEERIAANEELGRILDEQFEEEKALAQKKIDLAQMELNQNKGNIDLQVALINAKTEMADLDERITGQRSEQLVNLKALEKEEFDSWLKIQQDKNKVLADEKLAKDKALEEERIRADKEIEIARRVAETKRNIVANALGQVASLMGEESKAGKALAVAQALINTYSAATAALAPPPTGAGPIFGPIAAIGAIAAGMANVRSIMSTNLPGVDDSGGSVPGEPEVPTLQGNFVPNMEAIEQPTLGDATPVQAYVIENDISNAQALQEELEIQATL